MAAGNRTMALLFLATAVAIAAIGLATGYWLQALSVAVLSYLGWHFYHAQKLKVWLRERNGKLPDSAGTWSGIFRPVESLEEENRNLQRQLRESLEEFRSLTDAFPDATLVIEDNDAITWFNEAARRLLGFKDPEDLGQPVTNLVRDPDFADWLGVQDHVGSGLEMACPHKEHVRLFVNAVHFREGQRLLIFRDITDIHNLERVRRDFVANVSHELRTPLTVLLGYLEALAEDCPAEMRQAVEGMQSHTGQVQALLEDLLDLSRLQSDERPRKEQAVDIPALLMQLKDQAGELSQGQHSLLFEIQPDLWLHGDPEDLESAFRNLLANAINYTPGGGSVTVRWESTPNGPVLSVIDTGIGIPHRDIPRLTERFYRVGSGRSRNSGGTGLGLAIVKHVLNAHQAEMRIESELGTGSSFSCHFPAARGTSPERQSVT